MGSKKSNRIYYIGHFFAHTLGRCYHVMLDVRTQFFSRFLILTAQEPLIKKKFIMHAMLNINVFYASTTFIIILYCSGQGLGGQEAAEPREKFFNKNS